MNQRIFPRYLNQDLPEGLIKELIFHPRQQILNILAQHRLAPVMSSDYYIFLILPCYEWFYCGYLVFSHQHNLAFGLQAIRHLINVKATFRSNGGNCGL